MDDHQLRSLLHGTEPDLDANPEARPGSRRLVRYLAGPLLATALGLGACASSGQLPARSPAASTSDSQAGTTLDLPERPEAPRPAAMGPPPAEHEAPAAPVTDPRPPMDTPVPPMDPPGPLDD
jgi:hypothetical protein